MTHFASSQAFFESKYRQQSDPWNFEASDYEQGRYATMLRVLGLRRYGRAFEPGCSIGVLTRLLSPFCNRLEAIDIASTAVARAQQRCKDLHHVSIRTGSLPTAMPGGQFDLIVFSEIGYYFEKQQLDDLIADLVAHLAPGGTFLAAHWLGFSADHVLSGDEVHEALLQNAALSVERSERFPHFRLDRMVRR